jgi:hypothetical protein
MYNFRHKISNLNLNEKAKLLNARFDLIVSIDCYDYSDWDLCDEHLMISSTFSLTKDNYEFDITQGY